MNDWMEVSDHKWTLTVDGVVYIIRKDSDGCFLLNAEFGNPPVDIKGISLTSLFKFQGTLDEAKFAARSILDNDIRESHKGINEFINGEIKNINAKIEELDQPLPPKFSDWVERERKKDPDNLCDPPIEYNVAVKYLIKYLVEDDWYVAMPESPKQVTTACVWHILERYSPEFRKELAEKASLRKYECELNKKIKTTKRKYERKMERRKERNLFKRLWMLINS